MMAYSSKDPICHNRLNAYFRAVREELESLTPEQRASRRALHIEELMGAMSANAQAYSAAHAELDRQLHALESELDAAGQNHPSANERKMFPDGKLPLAARAV